MALGRLGVVHGVVGDGKPVVRTHVDLQRVAYSRALQRITKRLLVLWRASPVLVRDAQIDNPSDSGRASVGALRIFRDEPTRVDRRRRHNPRRKFREWLEAHPPGGN